VKELMYSTDGGKDEGEKGSVRMVKRGKEWKNEEDRPLKKFRKPGLLNGRKQRKWKIWVRWYDQRSVKESKRSEPGYEMTAIVSLDPRVVAEFGERY
jgi:hypothetical protein